MWENRGNTAQMQNNDLISRMAAINGKPLSNLPAEKKSAKQLKQSLEQTISVCESSYEDEFGGISAKTHDGSNFLLIEKPASGIEANADIIYRRFVQLTGYPNGEAVERISETCKMKSISPENILFLDIETTGLGMTPVFLIGTMECIDGSFMFKQYFARSYSEEQGILSAVSERLKDVRMLVTFNGKTFDMPFIANRAASFGIYISRSMPHIDLLYESRKLYKGTLPNCKLQTIEKEICGRFRDDDIPSAEIPAAYKTFIRTGNTKKIGNIIQHNLYDIFTMADIMTRMWRCE